ncbi:MAG: FtsX-like permease family protein [Bacteroidetes bacterium]|nr:FtsX-like permease family protein [Bacteroidota bacterium]MBU2472197.1 FtsX-like permease family protein [Bacteroidota bacterium]
MISIVMRGMQIGTYELNINNVVKMFSGYLQIQRINYQSNPSIQLRFPYDDNLKSKLKSESSIIGYSPRVYGDGLVSFKDNSLGATIFGIDPATEYKVTDLQKKLNAGKFFESDSTDEVVVGYKLLKNLNASIGDKVVLLAQGYDGSLGNILVRISGTVKTGSPEFDGMAIFIGLSTAQYLLGLEGNVHAVAISLQSLDQVNHLQKKLSKIIDTKYLAILPWDEVNVELKQHLQMDNISGIFFLAILIIIVAFGILNTVLMSVTERFREFGVSLSIGMPQLKLVYVVFIESIFITVIGVVFGNLIGAGINYYLVLNPIEIGGEFGDLYSEFGFLPVIISTLRLHIFVNSTLSIVGVTILSCLYPAYKVFKLEPLKGLRHT